MKTHMLLRKLYSWRIALFALAIIFTSTVVPLSGLNNSTVNAANTPQDCYDKYNNKDVSNTQLPNDCQNSGCQYNKPIQGKISCPDPHAIPADVQKKADDAEVAPLIKAVCGTPGIGDASISNFTKCANIVRPAYFACDTVIIPIQGPVPDTDANTAKCVYGKLSSPKPALAKVQAAVKEGRGAAATIIAEQQQGEGKKKCEDDGGTWENNACTQKGEDKTTCAIEGIGWIICPVLTFMSKLNDAAFGFLNNFLEVPARIFNDPSTKQAWEAFRNIGNVAFVIAFLIIIYSQLTGMGVSNYGVKKLLPKLIVAAVLVNVSFYVCGILVDLSNIVGATLYDLLKNLQVGDAQDASKLASIWTTVGAAVLAAGAVVGLIALIIFAPTTLLAFAVVILILIARQAFVILLIVVSPLAFVAYLLPNTESWFKRWWKTFVTVLMVYPIVSLIFGASTLAANVLNSAGQGSNSEMMQLTAAALMGIPLLAVPPIIKGAVAAAGTIGAKVASYQDKANKSAARGVKEGRLGEAKTAFNARRQVRSLNRRRGSGFIETNKEAGGVKGAVAGRLAKVGIGSYRLGSVQKTFDESAAGQYLGGNRGAAAATAGLFHEADEEVKRQKTLTSGRDNKSLLEDIASGKGSDEYQAAIAGTIMSRGHRESHLQALKIVDQKMRDATARGDTKEQGRLSTMQKQMFHDMKDKPFGVSDSNLARLEEGTYGQERVVDPTTKKETFVADTGADIYQDIQKRVGTKLSEEKLAHMNPDETKVIYEQARRGLLTTDQKNNLVKTINDMRAGRYKGDVKPELAAMHEEILQNTYSPNDKYGSRKALSDTYTP